MSAGQQGSDSQYGSSLHCRNTRELTVFGKSNKMRIYHTFILRLEIVHWVSSILPVRTN